MYNGSHYNKLNWPWQQLQPPNGDIGGQCNLIPRTHQAKIEDEDDVQKNSTRGDGLQRELGTFVFWGMCLCTWIDTASAHSIIYSSYHVPWTKISCLASALAVLLAYYLMQ